jgi:hypothetical protein
MTDMLVWLAALVQPEMRAVVGIPVARVARGPLELLALLVRAGILVMLGIRVHLGLLGIRVRLALLVQHPLPSL